MTKAAPKPIPAARGRKLAQVQMTRLREQMEDLQDYLAVLDARVRDAGKPNCSTDPMRQMLGLKPC